MYNTTTVSTLIGAVLAETDESRFYAVKSCINGYNDAVTEAVPAASVSSDEYNEHYREGFKLHQPNVFLYGYAREIIALLNLLQEKGRI